MTERIPIIGVHKWFARRPGALFRGLLLAEYAQKRPLKDIYFNSHDFPDVTILDPFMGGGTTLFEANRIGCNVIGFEDGVCPLDTQRDRLDEGDFAADVDQVEHRGVPKGFQGVKGVGD